MKVNAELSSLLMKIKSEIIDSTFRTKMWQFVSFKLVNSQQC